jgi:hypothetical protein
METTPMTTAPRFTPVKTTEELPKDMVDLGHLIATLPLAQRAQLEPVFGRVAQSARRRRQILNLVQEALSQLRLDMKYLIFDLETTRRERDAYRRSLEDGRASQEY